MKINWSEKLLDLKKAPLRARDGQENMTLGMLATECLLGVTESEKNLPGKEKYDLYRLAMKIEEEPKSDFSIDELSKVKDHIGRKSLTLFVGRAYDIIEGATGSSQNSKEK